MVSYLPRYLLITCALITNNIYAPKNIFKKSAVYCTFALNLPLEIIRFFFEAKAFNPVVQFSLFADRSKILSKNTDVDKFVYARSIIIQVAFKNIHSSDLISSAILHSLQSEILRFVIRIVIFQTMYCGHPKGHATFFVLEYYEERRQLMHLFSDFLVRSAMPKGVCVEDLVLVYDFLNMIQKPRFFAHKNAVQMLGRSSSDSKHGN